MKIKTAEYVISAPGPAQFPVLGLPEITVVGRSNVGKSSFINRLTGYKKLARTSSDPGKTRYINFYLINTSFYLADLPGYGFARVSKEMRKQWVQLIEGYLSQRKTLIGVMQIVDLRHPPSKEDVAMFQMLRTTGCPPTVIANKSDKISKGRQKQHLAVIKKSLGLISEPILFSALTGQGLLEVHKVIDELLPGQ
ncbi:MAG: ribosome biogenesis GTP-binding protein YihA/YsxC [Bacillota bacterium]